MLITVVSEGSTSNNISAKMMVLAAAIVRKRALLFISLASAIFLHESSKAKAFPWYHIGIVAISRPVHIVNIGIVPVFIIIPPLMRIIALGGWMMSMRDKNKQAEDLAFCLRLACCGSFPFTQGQQPSANHDYTLCIIIYQYLVHLPLWNS